VNLSVRAGDQVPADVRELGAQLAKRKLASHQDDSRCNRIKLFAGTRNERGSREPD
jgi:hypothetical protein